jgi:hypothetical protein
MSDRSPASDDGLQHPLVHEPGENVELDSNERGDDKAAVEQPSGAEVPEATAE